MVYRGPNNGEGIIVYHDGVNKGNDTTRRPFSTSTPMGIVKIGRRFDEPSSAYHASVHINELLFFNRQLLQSEIIAVMKLV